MTVDSVLKEVEAGVFMGSQGPGSLDAEEKEGRGQLGQEKLGR